MHKKDKTITFKGKGSLFIPRNIIRSEYPEVKNNDDNDNNNNDDNSEIYINLYKPDAYGVFDDNINALQHYNVFDNLLDPVDYIVEHDLMDTIVALYLRNDLEFSKCIENVYVLTSSSEGGHTVRITHVDYSIILDGNYSLVQFGDTNYYCVGMDLGQIDPANPK